MFIRRNILEKQISDGKRQNPIGPGASVVKQNENYFFTHPGSKGRQIMKLTSVNIGKERSISDAKPSGRTGIYKLPIYEPVRITATGIRGDGICDTKHHGGPDKAVYIYGLADYQWWSETMGQELIPGTFGENLTISDLESGQVRVGDVIKVREASLQVTSPRMPCVTLAARMGDAMFKEKFRQAERPGLYCRVLKGGQIQAGETVLLEPYTGETVTILEMFHDYYASDLPEPTLRHSLSAPISIRARGDKKKQLQKLLGKLG